jgi:hypothetical protein
VDKVHRIQYGDLAYPLNRLNTCREAHSRSSGQDIPRPLLNPKVVHFSVHTGPYSEPVEFTSHPHNVRI